MPAYAIAERCGVPRLTICRVIKALGWPMRNQRLDTSLIARIIHCVEVEDRGIRETARMLGVGRGCVYRYVSRRRTGESVHDEDPVKESFHRVS